MGNSPFKKRKIEHWQIIAIFMMVYDAVTVVASYFLALLLRFDFRYSMIDPNILDGYIRTIPVYTVAVIVVFWLFKLYKCIWRFFSVKDAAKTVIATGITLVLNIVFTSIHFGRMPVSYYAFGIVFQFIFSISIRAAYRTYITLYKSNQHRSDRKNVLIIGAGNAGRAICADVKLAKETSEKVACFIDDNPNKWRRYVDDVLVYGGRDSIAEAVEKFGVKKIYIALPSVPASQQKAILETCKDLGCELKQLPGIYQFRTGEVSVSKMKNVDVLDLLGRDPIAINNDEVFNFLTGKVVLVTGGGGSIGSELCRQIAKHNPKQLIIFDVYENNAYDIQLELKRNCPDLNLETIIGSVRDSRKMWNLFETYKPDAVYHAAAHKHVPLMEDSPCEAIKNNAIGTYKTAYAAMVFGVKRFVLISTDKAVNPTNIMGASKRLCEMIIQSFDAKIKEGKADEIPQLFTHLMKDNKKQEFTIEQLKKTQTQFVAVRFGNVLGSNGSVIPLFKKQIAEGGPVTVTHPDIIRYFMTIPEAVSLVLQAGTYANGGNIFVLDMGEPVKIDTLARNLIKLSGFKPDVDIKVEYTGLRPGEKLYEEKLMAEEGLEKTPNNMIHIGKPIAFDTEEFLGQLARLLDAAYKNSPNIRDMVQKVVSTYHPA